MAKCSNSKNRNACRNLTKLIRRSGACVDIELGFVQVTCRKRRPKIQEIDIHWPIVPMRGWCKYLFEHEPGLLLGGHSRGMSAAWMRMFSEFWSKYRAIKPDHELYSSNKPLGQCIPFMTHGDEGVSHRRVPFLVESWQPVISYLGPGRTTVSGKLVLR